jgi:hypothetical protein
MAGTNIVSAYVTIAAIELRMATTFQAEIGISFPETIIKGSIIIFVVNYKE